MKKITRDENGLIEGIKYHFDENGLIDWRKMIPREFLVIQQDRLQKVQENLGKPIENIDILDVEDKDLLILLGGIKYLAKLRGFTSVKYNTNVTENNTTAVCEITWKPNYETENEAVVFSSVGDANLANTNGFASIYLGPIAENRAFTRCVRNFLNINIVGKEEICESKGQNASLDPHNSLEAFLKNNNVNFEKLKNKLLIENEKNPKCNFKANDWNSIRDIPKSEILEITNIVKKLLEKKKS